MGKKDRDMNDALSLSSSSDILSPSKGKLVSGGGTLVERGGGGGGVPDDVGHVGETA